MKNKMFAVFLILAGPALWATDGTDSTLAISADQLIYPTAQVLPALHLNAQGGYVNLAKMTDWWPSLRLGLADVVEVEWTQRGFYSDLQETRQTIPTVGIKFGLPSPFRFLDLAVALYNAQQWEYRQSDEYNIWAEYNFDALHAGEALWANLRRVDFESIYSRLDFLASLSVGKSIRLHSSAYYLESKSRNLSAVWEEPDSMSTYEEAGTVKNSMPGFALGLSYASNPDLTYIAQWVIQPQYHFDVDAKELVLEPRYVWIAGVRYRLFGDIYFDIGVFNEEEGGSLSDVQVFSMLSITFNGPKIVQTIGGAIKRREATRGTRRPPEMPEDR